MPRSAEIVRTTSETDIRASLALDGSGATTVDTGVPFFDHMLDAFGRHGLFDLTVGARGDLAIDAHHTVEDDERRRHVELGDDLGWLAP